MEQPLGWLALKACDFWIVKSKQLSFIREELNKMSPGGVAWPVLHLWTACIWPRPGKLAAFGRVNLINLPCEFQRDRNGDLRTWSSCPEKASVGSSSAPLIWRPRPLTGALFGTENERHTRKLHHKKRSPVWPRTSLFPPPAPRRAWLPGRLPAAAVLTAGHSPGAVKRTSILREPFGVRGGREGWWRGRKRKEGFPLSRSVQGNWGTLTISWCANLKLGLAGRFLRWAKNEPNKRESLAR